MVKKLIYSCVLFLTVMLFAQVKVNTPSQIISQARLSVDSLKANKIMMVDANDNALATFEISGDSTLVLTDSSGRHILSQLGVLNFAQTFLGSPLWNTQIDSIYFLTSSDIEPEFLAAGGGEGDLVIRFNLVEDYALSSELSSVSTALSDSIDSIDSTLTTVLHDSIFWKIPNYPWDSRVSLSDEAQLGIVDAVVDTNLTTDGYYLKTFSYDGNVLTVEIADDGTVVCQYSSSHIASSQSADIVPLAAYGGADETASVTLNWNILPATFSLTNLSRLNGLFDSRCWGAVNGGGGAGGGSTTYSGDTRTISIAGTIISVNESFKEKLTTTGLPDPLKRKGNSRLNLLGGVNDSTATLVNVQCSRSYIDLDSLTYPPFYDEVYGAIQAVQTTGSSFYIRNNMTPPEGSLTQSAWFYKPYLDSLDTQQELFGFAPSYSLKSAKIAVSALETVGYTTTIASGGYNFTFTVNAIYNDWVHVSKTIDAYPASTLGYFALYFNNTGTDTTHVLNWTMTTSSDVTPYAINPVTEAESIRLLTTGTTALDSTTALAALMRLSQFSNVDTLNLFNIESLGMFGDSYWYLPYVPYGEGPLQIFSEMSDWNVENFAISGATLANGLGYLYDLSTTFGSDIEDLNVKYAFSNYMINDRVYYSVDTFGEVYDKWVNDVLANGITPVLCTTYMYPFAEYFYTGYAQKISEVAQRYDVKFIDMLKSSNPLSVDHSGNRLTRHWALDGTNDHPNKMSKWFSVYGLLREFTEKPNATMKIWRVDSTRFGGEKDSLRFYDTWSKNDLWNEISIRQGYGYLHTGGSISTKASEYKDLRNSVDVPFKRYSLVEATLPINASSELWAKFFVDNGTYEVYTLRKFSSSNLYTDIEAVPDNSYLMNWESVGSFTDDTLFVHLTALDHYLDGKKIYFLIEKSTDTIFNMNQSPEFYYIPVDRERQLTYQKPNWFGDEILDPYFNLTGGLNWTLGSCTYIDTDTLTFTFPTVDSVVFDYSPKCVDDSVLFIEPGNYIYQDVSLTGYEVDKYRLELISECADDSLGELEVQIGWDNYSSLTQYTSMRQTTKIKPIWFYDYIYFRKPYLSGSDIISIKITNTGNSAVYLAKVGLRRAQ